MPVALHIVVKPALPRQRNPSDWKRLQVLSKPTLWRNSRHKVSFRSQSISFAECGFCVLTWHSLCSPFAPDVNQNQEDLRMFAEEPTAYLFAFKEFLLQQQQKIDDPGVTALIAEIERELLKRPEKAR